MHKILITTSSFDVARSEPLETLRRAGFEIINNPYARRLTEQEANDLLGSDVIGMIAGVEPLTRRVIQGAKGLRVISRAGIGMDSVDLQAARESNIAIYNTPDAPVAAAAELAISLMLDVLRHVTQSDRDIRKGIWKPAMGKLLAAQTVGVIGYGRIGRHVSALLRAFGSEVLVHDVASNLEADGSRICSLDEMLASADIVSLHIPYSGRVHHMVDRNRIISMKKGAILINTARGGLIDEEALFDALKSGHIAGAGLDTFEVEPYEGPLAELPTVVMTAHMGSYARETRMRMEDEAAENLLKGLISAGIVADTVSKSG